MSKCAICDKDLSGDMCSGCNKPQNECDIMKCMLDEDLGDEQPMGRIFKRKVP